MRLFGERAVDVAWERTALSALIKQIVGELKLKMPQVAVPLRVYSRSGCLISQIGETLHVWHERYRTRRELTQWSNRDLHDVGVAPQRVAQFTGDLGGSQTV